MLIMYTPLMVCWLIESARELLAEACAILRRVDEPIGHVSGISRLVVDVDPILIGRIRVSAQISEVVQHDGRFDEEFVTRLRTPPCLQGASVELLFELLKLLPHTLDFRAQGFDFLLQR
jgi:hypothetical protein